MIGNGFDRWQGLPTSYDQFKMYYRNNIYAVAKELCINTTVNKAGALITPVEMIFGDIFRPAALSEEFFWNFESSMALLDDQNIIDFLKKQIVVFMIYRLLFKKPMKYYRKYLEIGLNLLSLIRQIQDTNLIIAVIL